jgi:hemolysin activation/secretion protein
MFLKGHNYLLVLVGCAFLLGAQGDFPDFSMPEYEDVIRSETFEVEIPEVIDVPRVSAREQAPSLIGDDGPQKLPITEVIIEGVVPFPEKSITREQIQAVIDRELVEQRATDTDENGFTRRDLLEIGAVLREITDRPGNPDMEDLQSITDLVLEQEAKRTWITIEQLDAIALAVTEYYRERGFILATAFIPEQEVQDGVIRLNVLEGRLGDVAVRNQEIFAPDTLKAAFSGELGNPVTEEQVEGALRRINDLPGVRVRGSFSPGDNVGETRLAISVLEEKQWSSNVLLDNHGSETTGETRLYATTEWNNVLNKGHRLLLGILRSEGPDSSVFGQAEYEVPVTRNRRGSLTFSASTNEFSVNRLANLPEIVGETDNLGLAFDYQVIRSRTRNLALHAGYTQKDVIFQVGALTTLSTDEKIENFMVAADYTQLWDDRQLLLNGRFGFDQGHVINGEQRGQSSDFTKVLLTTNLLKRFSFDNWLTKNATSINFVAKLNAQYTEKFLSSVEQFSLGGPTGVRAFGVSDVSVDSGAYAGFEMHFDLPVDITDVFNLPFDPIRPYVFYDYAYGVSRGLAGAQDFDAKISGWGTGFRLNWPGVGLANIVFARPSNATYQDDFLEAQGKSRFYIDVVYQIR